MLSPKLLKEFQQDYETVRAGVNTALLSIEAEQKLLEAKDAIRKTRLTRLEVGRALKRMHDTESWRDKFETWGALCRNLKLRENVAHRLMSTAEVHDDLPAEEVAKIPGGLSQRKLQTLAKADPEQRAATIKLAADAVDEADVNDAFAELTESLNTAPLAEVNDEVAAQPKNVNKISAVKRHVSIVTTLLKGLGLEEEGYRPFFNAKSLVAYVEAHAESA